MATGRTTYPSLTPICEELVDADAPAVVGLIAGDQRWDVVNGPTIEDPEDLVGFFAPPLWDGVAVIFTGRALALDGDEAPKRIRLAAAFARDGATVSVLSHGAEREVVDDGDRPVGRVADYCRRVLGLPTADEPVGPRLIFGEDGPSTWEEVHREVLESGGGFLHLEPAAVAWFDGASFGRHLLAVAGVENGVELLAAHGLQPPR